MSRMDFVRAAMLSLALTASAAERGLQNRAPLGAAGMGDQYLLTIGMDDYLHWPKLQCAVRDAQAVRDALVEQYGFNPDHVTALHNTDATERGITQAFRELGRKLTEDDSLLIFYAGHGQFDDFTGEGAWVPVEGAREDDANWIRCGRIKSYLRGIKARHVLLISDSCFAGDFFQGSRGAPPEITDAYVRDAFRKTSRQAITSGDLEPVVDAGFSGHSVFTHFLLKELRENTSPYLLPSDLHNRIKGGVAENARQTPKLGTLAGTGGEELGEFVLFRQGVGGSMEALIERKKASLDHLEQMEAQARAAADLARQVEAEKQKELDALDARIKQMETTLKTGAAGGGTLKELLALVEQKESQAKALEALKRKKAEEERLRKAEIEKLRLAQSQKREKAFDADYADYRKIVDSAYASDAIKARAWEAICQAWNVAGGRAPGALKWNLADDSAELTDVGTLIVRLPAAGKLRLGDGEWSNVEAGKGLRWASLPVGPYEVEAEVDGKPWRQTLTVQDEQTTDVTVSFEPKAGEEQAFDLGGGVKLEMVWIPAGSFMMGSPSGEADRDDNERQHRVTLSQGFWMGKYEVTQEQWAQVMGNNPSHFSGSRNPVEQVSWEDCQSFVQKLNTTRLAGPLALPGESSTAPNPGGRAASRAGSFSLPTEAQWEYACRAGTTGPYAGNLDSMAWYSSNSGSTTHPAGTKHPNAWGLYDMHGNVWEWCQDWYDSNYPSGSVTDPAGPRSGSSRVYRGGGWNDFGRNCRSAFRGRNSPSYRGNLMGLCLVRAAQ